MNRLSNNRCSSASSNTWWWEEDSLLCCGLQKVDGTRGCWEGHQAHVGVSAASCLLVQTWHLLGTVDRALTDEWAWGLTEAEEILPSGKGHSQRICLQQWWLESQCMRCDCLNHVHSPREPPMLSTDRQRHCVEPLKSYLTWHSTHLQAPLTHGKKMAPVLGFLPPPTPSFPLSFLSS